MSDHTPERLREMGLPKAAVFVREFVPPSGLRLHKSAFQGIAEDAVDELLAALKAEKQRETSDYTLTVTPNEGNLYVHVECQSCKELQAALKAEKQRADELSGDLGATQKVLQYNIEKRQEAEAALASRDKLLDQMGDREDALLAKLAAAEAESELAEAQGKRCIDDLAVFRDSYDAVVRRAEKAEADLAAAEAQVEKWEWVARQLQDRIYTLYEATEPNAIEIVLARWQPREEAK